MRYLQERFTDEEFQRLKAGKGDRTWREAMLEELAVDEGAKQ